MYLIQHLSAHNDINGNPRRLYLIYNTNADLLAAIDEGFTGLPSIVASEPHKYLIDLDINVSTYKKLLKTEYKL